jgi:capsular polysaccharide biosynthesis protein
VKTEFPISENIYALLLRAYPPSHREQYAAAMVQLFRDQCRDAWTEAGNFGLLKLWLRALPDLAGNSLRERLAAMIERKTMNDKLANLSAYQNYSPGKTFMRVFVPVFLIVVLVATAVTFILPEVYASTATIKVESDVPPVNDGMFHSDPHFLQTAFEIMKSESVLTNVVFALNLNDVWGKKYNGGEPLKTMEAIKILRQRLVFKTVRNTKIIAITVYSEDPKEAAAIANQVARAYQQYREQNTKMIQAEGLKVLETQLEVQSNQIQVAVSDMGTRLHSQSNSLQAPTELSKLDEMRQAYVGLRSKVNVEQFHSKLPIYTVVQVTDPAEPGKSPVKPNKTVNITIGVVGGILLASLAGGLVLLANKIARRKAGATAA